MNNQDPNGYNQDPYSFRYTPPQNDWDNQSNQEPEPEVSPSFTPSSDQDWNHQYTQDPDIYSYGLNTDQPDQAYDTSSSPYQSSNYDQAFYYNQPVEPDQTTSYSSPSYNQPTNYDQNTGHYAPTGQTASSPYGASAYTAAYETPVVTPAPKASGGKVFLFGFLGAALACIVSMACYFFFLSPQATTTTVLGSSGGTSITVEGESLTLPEVVAQKTLPSVVNIYVFGSSSSSYGYQSSSTASSLGSGVILSTDGYILTNYHVIEDGTDFVVVANAENYDATVVGTDPSSDLAVLKIEASGLTPIEIGSSSDLVVGEWVMAVGSPFGLDQTVTTGIVSATSRSTSLNSSSTSETKIYTNMIQTDAAINPGNSGGALVNSQGQLIGINTLIASGSGYSAGVGFAIPVDYAIGIAEDIISGKEPSHAQLGITMVTLNSQTANQYDLPIDSGVYVNSVLEGSAAATAGLQPGDIITEIDGVSITSTSSLMIDIRSHKIGDTISLTYYRDGQSHTVDVTLGSDA